MAAGQAGRRLISPRRLAALLGQKEPRPVPSPAARAVDAAIAAVATIAALVAAIVRFRTVNGPFGASYPGSAREPVWQPQAPLSGMSPWALLGVALTTAPLAFRRTYPITAFCVILAAVLATSGSTHDYDHLRGRDLRRLQRGRLQPVPRGGAAGRAAGAVIATAVFPDTTPQVPARFTALLVLPPTAAVGIAMRGWRQRAGDSAERLLRAEAEHEAQTRRAVEAERARIAGELHDVVTHNVSVMVVQAGAARSVLASSPGDAREALLAVEASGRTAMSELRHLLGLLARPGRRSRCPGARRRS